jgi:hypothetical protein
VSRPVGFVALILVATSFESALGQTKPRARDLGVPFDGTPGPLNAITDVKGVEVGHTTLISGHGKLKVGVGPVRTGVTAVLPRGKKAADDPVMAGWFTLNGNGEMTGTSWIEESGFLGGPVMITNTHSVGVVRDAVIEWLVRHRFDFDWSLPIVAETWDGSLNDINGFHVTRQHAFTALDSARGGPVAEGNVGGGTGMVCHQFKEGSAPRHDASRSRARPTRWACWCSATMPAAPAAHRRRPRRRRDRRSAPLLRHRRPAPLTRALPALRREPGSRRDGAGRARLDHRRGGDRRAAVAASAQAGRHPRLLGIGRMGGLGGNSSATSSWRSPPRIPTPPPRTGV